MIANGIKADRINKMQEGRPNIVDAVMNGKIQLIINTPATQEEKVFDDSYVRKTAIRAKVPYMTTMAAARATAEGIEAVLNMVRSVLCHCRRFIRQSNNRQKNAVKFK